VQWRGGGVFGRDQLAEQANIGPPLATPLKLDGAVASTYKLQQDRTQ